MQAYNNFLNKPITVHLHPDTYNLNIAITFP
jgi:hypothetical protein